MLFVQKGTCAFFSSLTDRCQIVTDTYEKMCQSLLGSRLNYLYHLYANNYVSLKPLSIILKTSVFFINCSQFMEDIPVLSRNYSPKSFELFWHAFWKKICFSLASVCLCLEKLRLQSWVPPSAYGRGRYWRPRAQFLPIRTFRLMNNIYLCCLN